MSKPIGSPRVYISYTWHTPGNKERAIQLADRLRAEGIDSRIDLYYAECRHGFLPPEGSSGDPRPAWMIWQENEINAADRVLIVCSSEYYELAEHPDDPTGKLSGTWHDVHFMKQNLASGSVTQSKFIPVGYGPYSQNSHLVLPFLKGGTYYDLSPSAQPFGFDDLLRRFKTEFPRPRSGVFVSYSHKDKKWLDLLLEHLAPLRQRGMKVWTDQEIEPGELWHQEIEERLGKAQVAVLLVTPSFLSSSYVASHELPTMLAAAKSDGLVIFWIPVIASSYKETEIAKFQAAHDPSRPLKDLNGAKRAEALVNIAARLSKSSEAVTGA